MDTVSEDLLLVVVGEDKHPRLRVMEDNRERGYTEETTDRVSHPHSEEKMLVFSGSTDDTHQRSNLRGEEDMGWKGVL